MNFTFNSTHNIPYGFDASNSNTFKFIEMENETMCDFYVLITSAEITDNENKKTELNKFVKDEVLSFLSRLNLYR